MYNSFKQGSVTMNKSKMNDQLRTQKPFQDANIHKLTHSKGFSVLLRLNLHQKTGSWYRYNKFSYCRCSICWQNSAFVQFIPVPQKESKCQGFMVRSKYSNCPTEVGIQESKAISIYTATTVSKAQNKDTQERKGLFC